MLKVGIIGCGGMGNIHSRALKALSASHNVCVAALADCRAAPLEKVAALWPHAARYASGMQLLENEALDAVHICLPSDLHTAHALKAMERDMDVLIEKPVCLNAAEGQRLLEARSRYGAKVLVGQVLRFFPEYAYLRQVYNSKSLGSLKWLAMQRLSGDVCWGFEDWFHDEGRSGSVVLDLHVHDVDFLLYMLGQPNELAATGMANENKMTTHILSRYRFGEVFATAEGLWDVSKAFPFEAGFRAHFEKGTLVYNSRLTPQLMEYHSDGASFEPKLAREAPVAGDTGINISGIGPYYAEIKYFVECLRSGTEPEKASLHDGIESVMLALRELALAKNHKP